LQKAFESTAFRLHFSPEDSFSIEKYFFSSIASNILKKIIFHTSDSGLIRTNRSLLKNLWCKFSHAILRAACVSGSWQCISEQDTKTNVILAWSTSCLYQLRIQCLPTRAYHFVLVDPCQLCRLLFPNWTWFWFTDWGQGHSS